MKDMRKEGYFTTWIYDDDTRRKSHRIYYNDIEIATADLICDGSVVGNVKNIDRHMDSIDKKNNYMW